MVLVGQRSRDREKGLLRAGGCGGVQKRRELGEGDPLQLGVSIRHPKFACELQTQSITDLEYKASPTVGDDLDGHTNFQWCVYG